MDLFRLLAISIFIFFGNLTFAQIPAFPDDSLKQDATLLEKGNILIEGDGRIGELEERYKQINEKEQKINGYRIQIFSNSGTQSFDQATEVQTEFLKIYPEIKSYIIHQKPRFKVRIGDYRTRLDAERFYIELKENFPDAFIVRDRINFPVLEIEKEDDEN
jgi:hypothetical protein